MTERFAGSNPAPSSTPKSSVKPPSSSGLGHHPFKVKARVRIPLGVRSRQRPVCTSAPLAQRQSSGLLIRGFRVRNPGGAPPPVQRHAPLAQRQSSGLLSRRFRVRNPGGAPPATHRCRSWSCSSDLGKSARLKPGRSPVRTRLRPPTTSVHVPVA